MKHIPYLFMLSLVILLQTACGNGEQSTDKKTINTPDSDSVTTEPASIEPGEIPGTVDPKTLDNIDLQQDLSNKSLQELRILRNAVFARYGYLFMSADLRGFFNQTDWYADRMEERWWAKEDGNPKPEIQLTPDEQDFVDRIRALEAEKKQQNFMAENEDKHVNINNVVNWFQFQETNEEFAQKLTENGFVIAPAKNIQLFHVYEQNDYHQIPNFVTTDMYLQLFHMYFGYVLKSLEQDKFVPIMTELSQSMYNEARYVAESETDTELIEAANYTATFFAIANYILTGKKQAVPAEYQAMYEKELQSIDNQKDDISEFLNYTDAYFPYSLFKPRGHYTRNETLKKYFKAMMWLQIAPMCREDETQLKYAMFSAYLLNTKESAAGNPLVSLYNSVFEPVEFIIGEADNLSVMDICEALEKQSLKNGVNELFAPTTVSAINQSLIETAKNRNRIKPKIEVTCTDKINFMPQRYLADNEIILELVDTESNISKRPYPKGLDVFAAFGSEVAENLLLNFHKEGENWEDYENRLKMLTGKFAGMQGLEPTVYNKWIESLMAMLDTQDNYPYFMQTVAWDKKNMNTALASWAELKHDAILYAEQPMAAECGGGGPPAPITVGYVEPNIKFWQKAKELLELTNETLEKNQLNTPDLGSKYRQMSEIVEFLHSASAKELAGQELSDQEYQTIEIIGSTVEYLTLSIVEPDAYLDSWENVQGPDKSVAVIADIYTQNAENTDKNGILHVGTGYVNDLFVVVEINGLLYLTKGATFSYYEFSQPPGTRLTDEEWQKMLESGQVPDVPQWIKDIMLHSNQAPITDERFFYSSGC